MSETQKDELRAYLFRAALAAFSFDQRELAAELEAMHSRISKMPTTT